MKDLTYGTDDLICALATPWAESALAVIRTTGTGTIKTLSKLFNRPEALLASPGQTIVYGQLKNLSGQALDEVTLGIYRAPRSYTGQESVEIFCHGSLPGIQRILHALFEVGFRQAGPGEFTLRAFLNRKMDLTRAEAVQEIISAKSEQAQNLALHRLSGSLEDRINLIKKKLLDFLSLVNIQLDYAEDDAGDDLPLPLEGMQEALVRVKQLSETFKTGQIYQEGVRVILAGRTNAGKSSLFNLFLKEDRSIVSAEHGTTRDYLENWVSLRGIPVKLFDTAGLRVAENTVEAEGIRRSRGLLESAHLILYLVDGSEGPEAEDIKFLESWESTGKVIKLWTKGDKSPQHPPGWKIISALSGLGFTDLEEELYRRILGGAKPLTGEPVIDSLRQKNLLDRTAQALEAVIFSVQSGLPIDMTALDLKEAMDALGEITGEVTTADILNNMFSNFCVGK